jgi:AmiR/NasT family two-component response regulator
MKQISRILIVAPNYQEIQSILEKYNYHIEKIVDNGEDALRALGEITVDVVFVHSELNGLMSGVETITFMLAHYHIPIFLLTNQSNFDIIKSIKSHKAMGIIFEPIQEQTLLSSLELGVARYHDYFNLFNEAKKFQNYVDKLGFATAIFQRGFCRYANSKFVELFRAYSENASTLSTFKFQKMLAQMVRMQRSSPITGRNEQPINLLSIHDHLVDVDLPDGTLKTLLFKSNTYEFKDQVVNLVSLIEIPHHILSKASISPGNITYSSKSPVNQSREALPETGTNEIDIIPEFTVFAEILGNEDLFLILDCLKTQTYDVNELTVVIGKSTDTVYRHLRNLQEKKIIIQWKDEGLTKYSLNPSFFDTLISSWRSFYASLELWFGNPI